MLFCVVPVSGVRVSAKELQREDSEKSGASKLRMGDLRRSPEQSKPLCLFFFGKYPSIT